MSKKFSMSMGLRKRYDVVVFNLMVPSLFGECQSLRNKTAKLLLTKLPATNMTLKAEYMMVTNGHNHYFLSNGFWKRKIWVFEWIARLQIKNETI